MQIDEAYRNPPYFGHISNTKSIKICIKFSENDSIYFKYFKNCASSLDKRVVDFMPKFKRSDLLLLQTKNEKKTDKQTNKNNNFK